jgi:protein ImuB
VQQPRLPSSHEQTGEMEGQVCARRPTLLLETPEPIIVMAEIPEGAPMRFTWRRVMYRVARSEGPERIEAEWWRQLWPHPGSRSRDYYMLEDVAGARFWVFRDGRYDDERDGHQPLWFVHGVFT